MKPLGYAVFGCLLIAALLPACSSGPPPVFDGLYLDYEIPGSDSGCRISFAADEKDLFRVTFDPPTCGLRPDAFLTGPPLVDSYLRSADGTKILWGEATFIWRSKKDRKKGSGLDDIREIKRWRNWETGVVRANIALLRAAWYYDLETGFLVGMEKALADTPSPVYILKDTNARAN